MSLKVSNGRRLWTTKVCIQPFIQRVRCAIHALSASGASSCVWLLSVAAAIAQPRQPDPEIGVLGHVVGIPPADLAGSSG